MSDPLSGLPVATVVNDADEAYVIQGGVAKRAPKSLLVAPAAAGNPNIIWQWDGTLGDFTNGAAPEVEDAGGGTLSVTTSFRGNPALRMTADAAANAAWAIDPTALSVTLPSRFTIDYEIEEYDDGVGGKAPGSQMGIMPFCQYNGSGDVLGYGVYGYGNINNFRQLWVRNTTIAASGATPGWRHAGLTSRGVECTMDVEMIIGATFDMTLKCHVRNVATAPVSFRYDDAGGLDYDAGRFNNETPNTIGIGGLFTAANHWVEFTRITLLKHPADR